MAFGSVPNCGASAGRSTGLFISDGTDSVLRILATGRENSKMSRWICKTYGVCPSATAWGLKRSSLGRKEILQDGASFVHLLWHFNLHKKQKGSISGKDWSLLRLSPVSVNKVSEAPFQIKSAQLTDSVCTSPQTSCSSGTPDTSGTARTWWKTFMNPRNGVTNTVLGRS